MTDPDKCPYCGLPEWECECEDFFDDEEYGTSDKDEPDYL